MKKQIIITGGSGGIGGAVARWFLDHGWYVHLLLRSFKSPDVQEMMKHENCTVYLSDPENYEQTLATIQNIKNGGNTINYVFHAAGTFLWDDGYPGKEKRPTLEVREILFRANVKTKESVLRAIELIYSSSLLNIEQGFVGSHAANFLPDSPERTGKYKEEEYVEVMSIVQKTAKNTFASGRYKNVSLFEPGLVNTAMAQEAFTDERIGSKVDWSTVPTPAEYAKNIFPESFFTARQ